jgi:hypothetical protein
MLFIAITPISGVFAQDLSTESAMDPPLPGNPFTQFASGLNPANWKMPKMKMPSMSTFLPTKTEQDRVITKKNSLVEEMSTTAKQSWQRTKTTLNPMRLMPAGFKQNSQSTPATKKEPGFFSKLFSPFPSNVNSEEKPNVNDFLKQEQLR